MNALAKANANKLINKYFFNGPEELNQELENMLYAEGLFIREDELENCEGKIYFSGNNGVITLNSTSDIKQKKFTLAHEAGHFFNEKGVGSYFCGYKELYGSIGNNTRESNANDFAAELLMHEKWFIGFTEKQKISYDLFSNTAEYFGVSLTAVTLRYSLIGYHPVAVIMSKDKIIKWISISKNFSYQFIRVGNKVSKLSYAYDFYEGKEIPEFEDIPAEAWFKEDNNLKKRNARIMEMNIPMPKYNSVLSVLWEI